MKNKGFTLIEVTGVVIILSLFVMMALPMLTNVLKSKEDDISSLTLELIKEATEEYVVNNPGYYKISGNVFCVPLQSLVNDNLLETPVLDVKSGKPLPLSKIVKGVVMSNELVNYTIETNCVSIMNNQYLNVDNLISNSNNLCDLNDRKNCVPNALNKVDYQTASRNSEYKSSLDYIYVGKGPNNLIIFGGEGNEKNCFNIVGIDNNKNLKLVYEGNAVYSSGKFSCKRLSGVAAGLVNAVWGNYEITNNSSLVKQNLNNIISQSNLATKSTVVGTNKIILTATDKSKIEKSQFYIGKVGTPSNLSNLITEERSVVTEEYVGLLNVSDIMKSVNNSICQSLPNWSNPTTANQCALETYLYNALDSWTMNKLNSNGIYVIDEAGVLKESQFTESRNIRPVIYLKNNVEFTGSGSLADPYVVR